MTDLRDVQPMLSMKIETGRYIVLGTTRECTVEKEFFADGPSLYEWVLYVMGERHESFRTKRDALAYCQLHTEL